MQTKQGPALDEKSPTRDISETCASTTFHIFFFMTKSTVEASIGKRKVLWTRKFMKRIRWQLQGDAQTEIWQVWMAQAFMRLCMNPSEFGLPTCSAICKESTIQS